MIKIYYWQRGCRKRFEVDTLSEAIDRKFELRRRYGHDFGGCSWFHYYEGEERKWL